MFQFYTHYQCKTLKFYHSIYQHVFIRCDHEDKINALSSFSQYKSGNEIFVHVKKKKSVFKKSLGLIV